MFHYFNDRRIKLSETVEAAVALNNGNDWAAYICLKDYVSAVKAPYRMTFRAKAPVTGNLPLGLELTRNPHSYLQRDSQHHALWNMCRKVAELYEAPSEDDGMKDEPEAMPEPTPEPEPTNPAEDFLAWIERVQRIQKRDDLDPWGMRQAINGAKLLNVGIPVELLKDAFTMDFDADLRAEIGVTEFNVTDWCKENMIESDESAFDVLIRKCGDAMANLCFVGGKGIGKTTSLENFFSRNGQTLAVVSCSPESSSREFYGVQTLKNFVMSEMTEALLKAEKLEAEGSDEIVGILLDEADCLDAPTAKMLNRMLEQKRISHPFLGRTISFGNNLRIFAAMNTAGTGADENYTAGERQDASFLDRFLRIRVTLDNELQRKLFFDILNG